MKKSLLITFIGFVCIELVLLCLILFASSSAVNILEFSSIVVAFAFSLVFICDNTKVILTQIALFFTVLADLFLEIVNPMIQVAAMVAFSIVQLLHFSRLFLELSTKKWKLINLFIRLGLIIVIEITTFIILKEKMNFLSAISMFYITNLLLNIVLSFFEFKKSPLFAFGLLLFLGCDIFVGLQMANGVFINIPADSILYKIIFVPFNIAWLCYLPSQVLISTSVINLNKNTYNQPIDKNL